MQITTTFHITYLGKKPLKQTLLFTLIILSLLLAACSAGKATVEPTVAPAATNPQEPAPASDPLLNHSWQSVSFTNPAVQYDIDMPENYVLNSSEEDTLTIVADCNTVLSSYTDDGGAPTVTPGPSTLVACPPESHSDQFVQLLEGAERYFFEDGNPYIDLPSDGGSLLFSYLPSG
jgi:heat shock protein HslJ